MGDAACQNSDAFQLLSGKSRILGSLYFGDVFDHGEAMDGPAVSIADQGCSQADPDDFALLVQISLSQLVKGYVASEKPAGKLQIRCQVVGVRDVGERQLEEFCFRVPYHLTKRSVGLQKAIVFSYECQ